MPWDLSLILSSFHFALPSYCSVFMSLKGDILEDPANEPKKDMFMLTVDPEDAPNQPE